MTHNCIISTQFSVACHGVVIGRCQWLGYSILLLCDRRYKWDWIFFFNNILVFPVYHPLKFQIVYIIVSFLIWCAFLWVSACTVLWWCLTCTIYSTLGTFTRIVDNIRRQVDLKGNSEKVVVWIIKGIFQWWTDQTKFHLFYSAKFGIWISPT